MSQVHHKSNIYYTYQVNEYHLHKMWKCFKVRTVFVFILVTLKLNNFYSLEVIRSNIKIEVILRFCVRQSLNKLRRRTVCI